MHRISSQTAQLVAGVAHANAPPPKDTAERRIVALGIVLTALALGYFYTADHWLFSTRLMAPIFRYLLMANDAKTAWLALAVCLLAALWRNASIPLKVVDFMGTHVTGVTIATVALFGLGAVFVYHNTAFSMDEYAAVFQAKIFAAGRITAQLPPSVVDWLVPGGFNGAFVIASRSTGQAIEAYWPGFSLILAPFEYLGIPWLCNASLAGCAVLLIHRITLEITGNRHAAGWAVLFALASGAFAANAISYYSMQAHLTANMLFVWLLLKPTPYRAFNAGVVGSLALVLHNPFPHALFAAPWIIAIARSKDLRRAFIPLMLGYLPLLIFLGAGWLLLRTELAAGNSAFRPIGNHLNAVFSFPDTAMLNMRMAAMVKMWIWAVPGLFLFAVVGWRRRGDDLRVRLLFQSAVMTFVGYVCVVFDQGHGWGYRYFHSAWGTVPILAACAMSARPESSSRLVSFAGAAAILNLFLVVPYQLTQIDGLISRHSSQLPAPQRPGNNVYFVPAQGGFYVADLIQMDPLLRTDDLILFSRGADMDRKLLQQNWPAASLVGQRFGIEEWNLGPNDQRRPSQFAQGAVGFVFTYTDRASTR
jgi:hypothetical protein